MAPSPAKSTATDAPYTLRQIEGMLGLGRRVISGLIAAGFVSPVRGARNEYRFSFQDVVMLRTAHQLKSARIPARRLLGSLRQLKAGLPAQMPLSGLRIRAIGNDVAVRNADAQWEAYTGQLLLDFEVAATDGSVLFLPRETDNVEKISTAQDWFVSGERLEDHDLPAAEAAYRQALTAAPDHANAALNLGALLCDAGRSKEAVEVYDHALARSPDEALIHFNRGIALEDMQRDRDALASYQRCLKLMPQMADAHYNAARLYEKQGDERAVVRHYSAYRRLQQ